MQTGGTDQIAAFIDNSAPQPASLPVTIVGRIGPEHEQKAKRHSYEGMESGRDRDRAYVVVKGDDAGSPGYADHHPDADFLDEGAAYIEKVIEPLMGIVIDHQPTDPLSPDRMGAAGAAPAVLLFSSVKLLRAAVTADCTL